ncbi:MAG: outer membrane beta-barrel protein [Deltaproteobacteria bacterium]|nr:outer membrane beta-barrel protein [Deltaproteobacteria bacterium]
MCRVQLRHFFIALAFTLPAAAAVDGINLNVNLGQVSLAGDTLTNHPNYSNALGFGFELGVNVNPVLDVNLGLGKSSNGALSILSPMMSAEFHVTHFYDLELTLGAGPGFYSFGDGSASETNFGLQFGPTLDVVIEDSLRFGVGGRYHYVFSPGIGSSYWTVMMRVGYLFALKK